MTALSRPTEVAVIGGGVAGCSIAYHLAQRGARVTLLEQREIASAASGASAGGVRQQGRDLRELLLAIPAIARWETLEQELEADVHYYREGHVQVIEHEDDLPDVRERVKAQQSAGLDIRIVDALELRDLVPGIAKHVIAGTYTGNDGHANPTLTTRAFAAAAGRHGASIRTNTRVMGMQQDGDRITGVRTTSGDIAVDWVVLAAGAWSLHLARDLGLELPIAPHGL